MPNRPSCSDLLRKLNHFEIGAIQQYRGQLHAYRVSLDEQKVLSEAKKRAKAELHFHAQELDSHGEFTEILHWVHAESVRINQAQTPQECQQIVDEYLAKANEAVEYARSERLRDHDIEQRRREIEALIDSTREWIETLDAQNPGTHVLELFDDLVTQLHEESSRSQVSGLISEFKYAAQLEVSRAP